MSTEESPEKITPALESIMAAREEMASKGYIIQVVAGSPTRGPSCAYTVGLSKKLGYEFMMFGNITIAFKLFELLVNQGSFSENVAVEWPEYTTRNERGVVPVRYIVKKAKVETAHHFGRLWFHPLLVDEPPKNVYQVFLPDGANRLPGEPGFLLPGGMSVTDLSA